MKATIFVLIYIATTLYAFSQDTLQLRRPQQNADSQTVIIQPPVPNRQTPQQNDRVEFTPENSVRVQPAEIPPVLRKTLEEVRYKGWENGVLYRNIINHEYMLELNQDETVKRYYFDQYGNPVTEE